MRKIFIQWAGVGILALIGWGVDLMPANTSWAPSVILWSISGVWFLSTLVYWVKIKNNLTGKVGRRKTNQWKIRLKRMMERIEGEYSRLADEAIDYPLNSYEEHYLLPINTYKQAKAENDTSHTISKNQLVMNGLMRYYRHINPCLEKLIGEDIKTNPKSVFKELKTAREQIDDDNISNGIRCMQEALIRIESVKILYELHRLNGVMLTPEDVNITQNLMKETKDDLTNTKRMFFKKFKEIK